MKAVCGPLGFISLCPPHLDAPMTVKTPRGLLTPHQAGPGIHPFLFLVGVVLRNSLITGEHL